jgi:hypothetical protein
MSFVNLLFQIRKSSLIFLMISKHTIVKAFMVPDKTATSISNKFKQKRGQVSIEAVLMPPTLITTTIYKKDDLNNNS